MDELVKDQLAVRVSEYLTRKKNVLEAIVQSQLITNTSKCLVIESDKQKTEIFSSEGEIVEIRNTQGDTDQLALDKLKIEILSFTERVYNEPLQKKTTLTFYDVCNSWLNMHCSDTSSMRDDSACYIDFSYNLQAYKENTALPDRRIIEFAKQMIDLLYQDETQPEILEFKVNLQELHTVKISKEEKAYLVKCSKEGSHKFKKKALSNR